MFGLNLSTPQRMPNKGRPACVQIIHEEVKKVSLIRKWGWGRKRVCLGIPSSMVMRDRILLPAMGLQKAKKAARLAGMQRLPFAASEILLDTRAIKVNGSQTKVSVDILAITLKDIIQPVTQMINNGYEITSIHPLLSEGVIDQSINFGDGSSLRQGIISEAIVRRAGIICGALMLLIFLIVTSYGFDKKRSHLSDIRTQQIAYLKRYQIHQEFTLLQSHRVREIEKFMAGPDSFQSLLSVYPRLPNKASIERIFIKSNAMELWGFVPNAQHFLQKLRRVAKFRSVELINSTLKNGKKEYFKIKLLIK